MPREEPYNPLDIENLGRSIATSMLNTPVEALSEINAFNGAGIYAIYYTGEVLRFAAYDLLASRNQDGKFDAPIYVGKAVPAGSRKGARSTGNVGTPLFKRLVEHKKSIVQSMNLDIRDFWYRHLLLEDIWIPLGESLLIESTRPLWNIYGDGFGNHPPGAGRARGKRPLWDMLHPGRPWATALPDNDVNLQEILARVNAALSGRVTEELAEDVQVTEEDSDQTPEP